jgi:hypothetical protein
MNDLASDTAAQVNICGGKLMLNSSLFNARSLTPIRDRLLSLQSRAMVRWRRYGNYAQTLRSCMVRLSDVADYSRF